MGVKKKKNTKKSIVQVQNEGIRLDSKLYEKDLRVLVDYKINMGQQCDAPSKNKPKKSQMQSWAMFAEK